MTSREKLKAIRAILDAVKARNDRWNGDRPAWHADSHPVTETRSEEFDRIYRLAGGEEGKEAKWTLSFAGNVRARKRTR